MWGIAWQGVRARRRRLASTTLAVVIGVAFLAGTLALGDTLRANFADLFADANAGTDVVVRSSSELSASSRQDDLQARPPLDAAVVEQVAGLDGPGLDGIAAVAPVITGYGQIRAADGAAIGMDGPPRTAGNWIEDPDLNPYEIAEGRAPEGPGEVVINRGAATDGDLHVGDTTTVEVPQPIPVTVVGIATFAGEDGQGPLTFAAFTTEEAARLLLGDPTRVSSLSVRAADGVDAESLRDEVAAAVPGDVEVLTGAEVTDEARSDIESDFLGLLTGFLTAFAAIALLVATISTASTFSTLVAQRSRESSLLRALGASRRQVLGATLLETLAVGVVGAVAGLAAGVGLAALLKAIFDAAGFPFPDGGLLYDGGTIVTSLVVGIVAALVAGVAPALRASRALPLAAVRDVAVDRSATSRSRLLGGLAVTAIGAALVVTALGSDDGLAQAGIGAALTVVGVVTLGPVVARPVTAGARSPLGRLRGITGTLAADGAARNPRRTAASASALLVGVAVVTLFTVFAASLKASIDRTVDDTFAGDLVVSTSAFGGSGLDPRLTESVRSLPEVEAAAGLSPGLARIADDDVILTGTDPASLAAVVDLGVSSGSLADLDADSIALSEDTASSMGAAVGDRLPVTFADGAVADLEVVAVYAEEQLVGPRLVDRAVLTPHVQQAMEASVLVALADGVGLDDGRAAVAAVGAEFGSPDIQDRDEYAESMAGGVDMLIGVVYALLALAIVIALLGIANTTSLAIHERTRELGLLRAVGQTRSQLRSMVRWESTVVATFGTVGGVLLGVFLGWALSQAGGDLSSAFALPVASLVVVLVLGAVAGVVAGIRPARRAARLNVLDAVAAV